VQAFNGQAVRYGKQGLLGPVVELMEKAGQLNACAATPITPVHLPWRGPAQFTGRVT
jgi:hypothetical protein